jgi:hypothetical protein
MNQDVMKKYRTELVVRRERVIRAAAEGDLHPGFKTRLTNDCSGT